MISRRQLLSSLAALPGVAAVRIEPALQPLDLVVVDVDQLLSDDERAKAETFFRQQIPGSHVLVLVRGERLRVERGIAKVEHPDAIHVRFTESETVLSRRYR